MNEQMVLEMRMKWHERIRAQLTEWIHESMKSMNEWISESMASEVAEEMSLKIFGSESSHWIWSLTEFGWRMALDLAGEKRGENFGKPVFFLAILGWEVGPGMGSRENKMLN